MTTQQLLTDTLDVRDSPAIAGLTFRGFRGEDDYPKMVAVLEAAKIADQIERTDSVEDIARFFAHLTNCDPYQDMLFAEVDGDVIGFARCEWRRNEAGERIYRHIGFLKPAWRRRGIGRAMLHWLQRRLRHIAAGHPDDGPRFFQTFAADTAVGTEALLRSEGYAAVRHFYEMVRPLSEPITVTPMPPGLEVRPARPKHCRAIWEADQEAFRDHWGYSPGTEQDYRRWLADPNFNPSLWQIAWDGGQVAGMVLNFVAADENREYNRARGYTEGISVRRPWRKRGLARALLSRSLQMFKDMGMTEAALGVDTENLSGALRLYESVSFRAVKRSSAYRKAMADGG